MSEMGRDVVVEAVDAVIEEFKVLVPDAREHLGRVEFVATSMALHLHELREVRLRERALTELLALDVEELEVETAKSRTELERRAKEIEHNSKRVAYRFGRVVAPIERLAAARLGGAVKL